MKKSIVIRTDQVQKEVLLQNLFSQISPSYDLINTILSWKSDNRWRHYALKISNFKKGDKILDLCAGTGEMAIQLIKFIQTHVTLVDFSLPMLKIAENKISKSNFSNLASYVESNIRRLPFANHTFNGAVMAFSLRNLPYLNETLLEIKRVLVPGSTIALLELTKPDNILLRKLYFLYLNHFLPLIGGLVSHKLEAYRYLAESIQEFYEPSEFKLLLSSLGFIRVEHHPLTFGIASVFLATCPQE